MGIRLRILKNSLHCFYLKFLNNLFYLENRLFLSFKAFLTDFNTVTHFKKPITLS